MHSMCIYHTAYIHTHLHPRLPACMCFSPCVEPSLTSFTTTSPAEPSTLLWHVVLAVTYC